MKNVVKKNVVQEEGAKTGRRKFLKTAAAAAGAATVATIGFPMVSRAATTILKVQGAWGAKDIFNEYAQDYVTRVNEMAGGRLKIQYLLSGAVVKAFQVQDAVHKGVLDGGHHVSGYWYGKSKVASLFGTGPVFGQNAHQGLAWIYYGGGQELWDELIADLKLNLVGFFCMPMPTQPLGWFKNPIKTSEDMRGLKYRTIGLAADLMQQMGVNVTQLPGGEIVPALERGVIEAFEYNNPTSDRRFGAQDVSKVYMLGSYHQAAEFFEIIFNKTKYEALPAEQQAILKYAAEAVSSNNFWKGQDQYSKDLEWLINDAGVTAYRTPEGVMKDQLDAWDAILPGLEKDPFFKKVVASQKAFAKRVAYYDLLNSADYKLAYDHYFPGKLGF
jgi:TRAP-type mannitol/chloroaromatic compound transport system substrate-binding protein